MAKKWKKRVYKEIGGSADLDGSMPVEGTEAPRSFADGTGKRKYAKGDQSVIAMRKARARAYRKYGVGIGLSSARSGTNSARRPAIELLTDFRAGRRKSLTFSNISTIDQANSCISMATGTSEIVLTAAGKMPRTTTVTVGRIRSQVSLFPVGGGYKLTISRLHGVARRKIDPKVGATKESPIDLTKMPKTKKRRTLLDIVKEEKAQKVKNQIKERRKAKKHNQPHRNSVRGLEEYNSGRKI